MTDAIAKAEDLLAAAAHDPGCNLDEQGGDCCSGCRYLEATAAISNNAKPTLRVAVTLAKALGDLRLPAPDKARAALAEFETLMGEEQENV